jgi:secreted PhoX family phosphatase
MQQKPITTLVVTTLTAAMSLIPMADAVAGRDFGVFVEDQLRAQANNLFGTGRPLEESAPATTGAYRTTAQAAKDQLATAQGLKVTYLTRNAADATDMMAFFPADNPTHLITCVEGGRQVINASAGKLNPSVQRINLASGQVETILRGMDRCDGIRTTPWGTILATEETTDGGAYEILDPLTTTEQSVTNRATGANTDPTHIAKRTALPTMAWEGIAVLPSGVVIGGDELRPGTGGADRDGGAIFKFIPTTPHGGGAISNLSASPLAAGKVYALQVSCNSGNQQYGQGCEIGNAAWVSVNAATARADADANGATGYYRPEDLHADPVYTGPGVRFCWTNTGTEEGHNYAEVMCAVDSDPLAGTTQRTVIVNRFVEGDEDFNSFDNLDFQPRTGILYVVEDHDNGDIFACLPDGVDRDIKTDGCIKVLSVKDSSAEPTGFIFSADGKTAYVSIQHSNDANMPSFDGYPTDDVLKITGFKVGR